MANNVAVRSDSCVRESEHEANCNLTIMGVISAKMLKFLGEGESAFFYLLWVIFSISK